MSEIKDDIFNIEKIFPEPYRVFEKDKNLLDESKDNALIVLDTNILLFPYTVSHHSLTSIETIYKKLISESRLFIPNQVAREFAKNRNMKLGEMYKSILDNVKQNKKIKYPILEGIEEYNVLLDVEKELEIKINEYNKKIKSLAEKIKNMGRNDPVSLIYYELFNEQCIVHHTKDENDVKADLKFRIENNIPPGYKDKKKDDVGIGDLLIWHTILELGNQHKKSLIFVSNDEKGDWYNQSNGSSFQPRYELIDEYKRFSDGNTIHIINFSSFLKLFEIDKKASIEIEKKEVTFISPFSIPQNSFNEEYENKKEEVKAWFIENYDDPANHLPYESKEGGYIEIYGSIENTETIIEDNYSDELPSVMKEEIVNELESEYRCDSWTPLPMDEYLYLSVHLDYETGDRCGAGGFQVISVENDESGEDLTSLIDVGQHYYDLNDVKSDISKVTGIDIKNIYLESV